MEQSELYSKIIETYAINNSVKKTAEELGTSVIKVRRVLITEGLWSSETSRKIGELYAQGLTVKEIAETLHYTEKNVQAFLPYSRGAYGDGKSMDAVRSREYRERNQQAAEKQVGSSADAPKGFERSEELDGDDECFDGRPIALKLHLELKLDHCSEQEWKLLQKYGKVNKGISRDILVPADMTLHALHYAIQRLFGWQNGHLHHYAFPEEVFKKLTGNKLSRWCSLAGIYFRFPTEELDDLYWDEDYTPDRSIKTWLKSKYRGPYHYGGLGDYYFENQQNVAVLKRELPTFEVRPSFEEFRKSRGQASNKPPRVVALEDASLEEFERSVDLGGGLEHLLERMTLMEYLYLPNNRYFLDDIDETIRFLEDGLDGMLRHWNTTLANIDEQYDQFCELVAFTTIRMQAQSDMLHYFYDYGDGWEVEISITDAYYRKDLQMDPETDLFRVLKSRTPLCLAADGLPVFDDIGGIWGYIDFLSILHNSEDEVEKEDMREHARSLGWTGRMPKPQNIL